MMVVITLSAFAFARLEFRGKNLAFTLFLSLMMIPNELVIITNFVTITNLDMRNTFLGLILPSVTSVFYIYLLKEFRAGSGRALPGSQGGRHLRSEIPVQGYDPHLQAHYGDHRHPEGN